jgi:acetyl-CoA acetyltransferase
MSILLALGKRPYPCTVGCAAAFVALNAKLMTLYMATYGVEAKDFAHFAINAHHIALHNPHAFLHNPLDLDPYLTSRVLTAPGVTRAAQGDKAAPDACEEAGPAGEEHGGVLPATPGSHMLVQRSARCPARGFRLRQS